MSSTAATIQEPGNPCNIRLRVIRRLDLQTMQRLGTTQAVNAIAAGLDTGKKPRFNVIKHKEKLLMSLSRPEAIAVLTASLGGSAACSLPTLVARAIAKPPQQRGPLDVHRLRRHFAAKAAAIHA